MMSLRSSLLSRASALLITLVVALSFAPCTISASDVSDPANFTNIVAVGHTVLRPHGKNGNGMGGNVTFEQDGTSGLVRVNVTLTDLSRRSEGYGLYVYEYGMIDPSIGDNNCGVSYAYIGMVWRDDPLNAATDVIVSNSTILLTGNGSVIGRGIILRAATDPCPLIMSGVIGAAAGASQQTFPNNITAIARIYNNATDGTSILVGELQFSNVIDLSTVGNGNHNGYRVRIIGNVTVPGVVANETRGWHIHQYGDISTPANTGGNFNPTNAQHGLPPLITRQFGDLGNIQADANGIFIINTTVGTELISLHNATNGILGRTITFSQFADNLSSQEYHNTSLPKAYGVIGLSNLTSTPPDETPPSDPTPTPTSTPTNTSTSAPPSETTSAPTNTSTATSTPPPIDGGATTTAPPDATPTPETTVQPPTNTTQTPPTNTTNTTETPTGTTQPPTGTPQPPTGTPQPPTNTTQPPPTGTPQPTTNTTTGQPPTNTTEPPTTVTPPPTLTPPPTTTVNVTSAPPTAPTNTTDAPPNGSTSTPTNTTGTNTTTPSNPTPTPTPTPVPPHPNTTTSPPTTPSPSAYPPTGFVPPNPRQAQYASLYIFLDRPTIDTLNPSDIEVAQSAWAIRAASAIGISSSRITVRIIKNTAGQSYNTFVQFNVAGAQNQDLENIMDLLATQLIGSNSVFSLDTRGGSIGSIASFRTSELSPRIFFFNAMTCADGTFRATCTPDLTTSPPIAPTFPPLTSEKWTDTYRIYILIICLVLGGSIIVILLMYCIYRYRSTDTKFSSHSTYVARETFDATEMDTFRPASEKEEQSEAVVVSVPDASAPASASAPAAAPAPAPAPAPAAAVPETQSVPETEKKDEVVVVQVV